MYELALFAGAGGGILGGLLNGWQCIGAVECEGYPRGVLGARQNDGCLDAFPIWTDVRSFTTRNNACRRYIRALRSVRCELVISGGFPCQDISAAGKGEGITGARSGLWKEFGRIVGEIRPRHVLVENSPILTGRGLGVVLGDLAALGYDAQWGVVGAEDAIWSAGDPCIDHERERIWIWATLPDTAQGGLRAEGNGTEGELDEAWDGGSPEGSCAEVSDAREGRFGEPEAGKIQLKGRAEAERASVDGADSDSAGCPWHKLPQSARRIDQGESAGTGATDANSDWPRRAQYRRRGGLTDEKELGAAECGGEAGAGRDAMRERWDEGRDGGDGEHVRTESAAAGWWGTEPAVGRVADGVAHRVDRIAATANGQVPAVVRLAHRILQQRQGE